MILILSMLIATSRVKMNTGLLDEEETERPAAIARPVRAGTGEGEVVRITGRARRLDIVMVWVWVVEHP